MGFALELPQISITPLNFLLLLGMQLFLQLVILSLKKLPFFFLPAVDDCLPLILFIIVILFIVYTIRTITQTIS